MRGLYVSERMARITLVAFKDDDVAANSAAKVRVFEKKGGHALDLVAALFVPNHLETVFAHNVCDHFDGRRFSVRSGDGDHVFRKGYFLQDVRAKLKDDLAGKA